MIRYDKVVTSTTWDTSRRCGLRFRSEYQNGSSSGSRVGWRYRIGTTDGDFNMVYTSGEMRCNCSKVYGPFNITVGNENAYYAGCESIAMGAFNLSCPKGWGRNYHQDNYMATPGVKCGQGFYHTIGSKPVYGYVTRYRTACYNYIATRVSKA